MDLHDDNLNINDDDLDQIDIDQVQLSQNEDIMSSDTNYVAENNAENDNDNDTVDDNESAQEEFDENLNSREDYSGEDSQISSDGYVVFTTSSQEAESQSAVDSSFQGDLSSEDLLQEIVSTENLIDFEDDEIEGNTAYRSPYDRPGHWYVVHTYAGYEKKVKSNLETRRESLQMSDKIYEIVIPMEDMVEVKAGKKYTVSRKVFPSYILVRCDDDSDAFEAIRRTPGVTGFVGAGNTPSRLTKREVETILAVKEQDEVKQKSKAKLIYEIGQTVRVKEGPFADFSGQIAEINEDQLKLQVLVNIFGRETPVELEFSQVAKL